MAAVDIRRRRTLQLTRILAEGVSWTGPPPRKIMSNSFGWGSSQLTRDPPLPTKRPYGPRVRVRAEEGQLRLFRFILAAARTYN